MEVLPPPEASTPVMYGTRLRRGDLLPWSWAHQRLVDARNYWVATVHPDARPHSRPVWGVWMDTGFWFSTGGLARHNLVANEQVCVHLEDGMQVVIIEGAGVPVTDPAALQVMCERYTAKYDYPVHPADGGVRDEEGNSGPAFRVVPTQVFGWEDEMSSPTRWRFR